jgi:hypothetical protein
MNQYYSEQQQWKLVHNQSLFFSPCPSHFNSHHLQRYHTTTLHKICTVELYHYFCVTSYAAFSAIMLQKFLDHAVMVNAGCYCTTLQHLKEAIHRKCSGWFTEKITLLHGNTHQHKADATKQFLEKLQQECLSIHHTTQNLHLVTFTYSHC